VADSRVSQHGITYQQCEVNKSELYLAFVAVTNSHGVKLPDDKRLLTQLRRLERKRGRAGRDSVDHPRLHDDLANAVAGVSYLLSTTVENTRGEFNPSLHVAREKLTIAVGDWPLFIGLSSGDGVVASVIGQPYKNEIKIFASSCSEGMSLRRHLSEYPRSWLAAHALRVQLMGGYEQNPELQNEVHLTAQEVLQGQWCSITKPWQTGKDKMLDTLTKAEPFTFRPIVQINPVNTFPLSQALNGRFYEKTQAEKKNYHTINAFSILLARLELWKATPKNPEPQRLPPSFMSA
jgi:hypothetical protein